MAQGQFCIRHVRTKFTSVEYSLSDRVAHYPTKKQNQCIIKSAINGFSIVYSISQGCCSETTFAHHQKKLYREVPGLKLILILYFSTVTFGREDSVLTLRKQFSSVPEIISYNRDVYYREYVLSPVETKDGWKRCIT